ncbi:hypothetical protein OBBRIDRAFT_793907 [Obba rivulosa]|uniref:G domain-containing protein n=1 Tax=Obba rivulosa TaxID=1052685 RepID=A0A8E2DIZ2_9APHY|nr:hypothetical protein OBBRIDRAFT_793907 [Obba rivulosa]
MSSSAGHTRRSERTYNDKAKEGRPSRRQATSDEEVIIAVMGPSGTGKSSFINLVSNSRLGVGHGLDSHTAEVQLSKSFRLDDRRVRLVDTPGFDDSTKSDADILNLIATFLTTEYRKGRKLSGVLYLHRISDVRMGGIARRNFSMFQRLCGVDALRNVVIATTRWEEVDVKTGAERQDELATKTVFFKPVLDEGAKMLRHDNGLESAQAIIRCFLRNQPKALLIQKEMVDEDKPLSETEAGRELQRDIRAQMEKHDKKMQELREEMQEAVGEHDEELRAELDKEMQDMRYTLVRLQNEAKKLAESQASPTVRRVEKSLPDAPVLHNSDAEPEVSRPSPVAGPASPAAAVVLSPPRAPSSRAPSIPPVARHSSPSPASPTARSPIQVHSRKSSVSQAPHVMSSPDQFVPLPTAHVVGRPQDLSDIAEIKKMIADLHLEVEQIKDALREALRTNDDVTRLGLERRLQRVEERLDTSTADSKVGWGASTWAAATYIPRKIWGLVTYVFSMFRTVTHTDTSVSPKLPVDLPGAY